MDKIVLSPIPLDEMLACIRSVVKSEIELSQKTVQEEKLYTPDEICALLKISRVTLWNYQNSGKITAHRVGRKVYYKYSEIMGALKHLKKYSRT